MGSPQHAAPRRNRPLIIAGIVLAAVLAFVAGMLLANAGGGKDGANPSAPPSASTSASAGSSPSISPSVAPDSPTSASSTSPTAAPVLEDGRHFAYVKKLSGVPPDARMTFDLAEFLTGDAAARAAAEHGDESPPPNDYYIVNDNPLLRTLPLSSSVTIRAIDWMQCCESIALSYPDWAAAVEQPTDSLRGSASQYWITVKSGTIVAVEEQYLP